MTSFKEFIGSTSYREAQAWVFAIINFSILTIYISEVMENRYLLDGQGLPAFSGLILVGVCTTVFTLFLITPTAIIFHRTANDRPDERDKRFYNEAGAVAFWTLVFTVGPSLVAYVFHGLGDLLFHTVLIAILIAQLVYALSIAIKYRRSGMSFLTKDQD